MPKDKQLTEKHVSMLRDLQGFIEYGIEGDQRFGWILSNIGHDLGGMMVEEEGFVPRIHGYSKYLQREDVG